jgi:hypothetical protein
MELIKLHEDINHGNHYCVKCGTNLSCPECGKTLDFCPECGEETVSREIFAAITLEKYHGADKPSNYTATLLIDGKDYAAAHFDRIENDVNIAQLQLGYIHEAKQTEEIAGIISNFAKWVRDKWSNADFNSLLPVKTQLIGSTTYNSNWRRYETWIALPDATQIKPEHLAYSFTSKTLE